MIGGSIIMPGNGSAASVMRFILVFWLLVLFMDHRLFINYRATGGMMDIDMTQPTFRQWVDVKVDLVNLKVIIRKTEHRVHEQTQTGDVAVFCLNAAGSWLDWPEGKAFPAACELPIAQFRDQDQVCPVCGGIDGTFVDGRWECFRCYWPDRPMTLED